MAVIAFPVAGQLLALLATLLGATACYLASPHRHIWRGRPGPAAVWLAAGVALLVLGAAVWARVLGPAPGLTAWLVAVMLTATAWPYLALPARRDGP